MPFLGRIFSLNRATRSKEPTTITSHPDVKNAVLKKAPLRDDSLNSKFRSPPSSSDHHSFSDSDVVNIDEPVTTSYESFDDLVPQDHRKSPGINPSESIPPSASIGHLPENQSLTATPADEGESQSSQEATLQKKKPAKVSNPMKGLRKEKAALERRRKLLEQDIRTLKDKGWEMEKQLQSASQDGENKARIISRLERDLSVCVRNREGFQAMLERIDQEKQHLQRHNDELQNMSQHLKQRMAEQQSVAAQQQVRLKDLLEVRTRDLNHAQAFLTLHDKYSGSDVRKMVEALNAEIFQAAAGLADLVESSPPKEGMKGRGWEQCLPPSAIEPLAAIIGDRLMSGIARRGLRMCEDTLPLQLAVQACFCHWSMSITDVFNGDEQLRCSYEQIRQMETQAVAARWRVMTSNALARRQVSSGDRNKILQGVLAILKMAGYSASDSEGRSVVESSLTEIENLGNKIKIAIGEHIMSSDMRLMSNESAVGFSPTEMEDSYPDGRHNPPGRNAGSAILCTVGLGLLKAVNVATDNGQYVSREEVLLRTKVALAKIIVLKDDW